MPVFRRPFSNFHAYILIADDHGVASLITFCSALPDQSIQSQFYVIQTSIHISIVVIQLKFVGSLLSLKKSKLLSYVDQAIGNQPDTSSSSNKTKTKNLQQRRHIIEKYTVGAKCKAPYQYSWGGIQYGNAVIVDTDQIDSSDIVSTFDIYLKFISIIINFALIYYTIRR